MTCSYFARTRHRLRRTTWSAGLLLIAVIGSGQAARAQAAPETDLQFNLTTPGARSLAMGGAFIGLADDATAAYTNPAGLTNLTVGGPEVAIEVRSWRFSNLFPERGNVSLNYSKYDEAGELVPGSPTGFGIDTVTGTRSAEAINRTEGLSFLSVGYVLPRGVTIALYRHELANFQNRKVSQGVFAFSQEDLNQGFFPCGNVGCRTLPTRAEFELSVVNYGLSAAYEFPGITAGAQDSLAVGLGISTYQLRFEGARTSFLYDVPSEPIKDRLPGGLFGPADFGDDNIAWTDEVDARDAALGFNFGFLWKFDPKRRWSLGGVYRMGPSFRYANRVTVNPQPLHPLPFPPPAEESQSLRIPDVYGLGLAYSAANSKTKLTLDYNRVRYSQRFDDLVPKDFRQRQALTLADANELHLGLEHVFLSADSGFVATLRVGAWFEPFHELQLVAGEVEKLERSEDDGVRLFAAALRGMVPPDGDDQVHWSGGLGLVIKEDFQVDLAADFSDRVNTVSLALVKFF